MTQTRIGILIFCLLAAPALVSAHGGEKHDGHHEDASMAIEEQPAVGSPVKEESGMAMEPGGERPVDYQETDGPVDYGTSPQPGMENAPQPSLGLEEDPLGLGPGPLDPGLGDPMQHDGHDMAGMKHDKHVEQATHKMVSTSSKGYGAAVGITILSGLVAGVLFLKRPADS